MRQLCKLLGIAEQLVRTTANSTSLATVTPHCAARTCHCTTRDPFRASISYVQGISVKEEGKIAQDGDGATFASSRYSANERQMRGRSLSAQTQAPATAT